MRTGFTDACLQLFLRLLIAVFLTACVCMMPHGVESATWAPGEQLNIDDSDDDWGVAIDVDNDGTVELIASLVLKSGKTVGVRAKSFLMAFDLPDIKLVQGDQ